VEAGPVGGGFTDGEKYMPLCRKCLRKYSAGSLKGIERRWQAEKRRLDFVAESHGG
jgi:hypothetical protein